MRGAVKKRGGGGSTGMKSVLSTKVKYLRLGVGPEFGVGRFIVILCFGTPELALYSGLWSGRGREALAVKGYEVVVFTKEHFDLTGCVVAAV